MEKSVPSSTNVEWNLPSEGATHTRLRVFHGRPYASCLSSSPILMFLATEASGGAYLHSGVLVKLDLATFVGNSARDAGLAIQSLGIVGNIFNTTFESNTYYCPAGQYGVDVDETEDEVIALFPQCLVGRRRRCSSIPLLRPSVVRSTAVFASIHRDTAVSCSLSELSAQSIVS